MAAIILNDSKDARNAEIIRDENGNNRVFPTVQAAADWQDDNDIQIAEYSRILDLDD